MACFWLAGLSNCFDLSSGRKGNDFDLLTIPNPNNRNAEQTKRAKRALSFIDKK
jgi:hypothetical protein